MSVGGSNTSESTVKILMMLFCSKLIRPKNVFCKNSSRSNMKFVWSISELISLINVRSRCCSSVVNQPSDRIMAAITRCLSTTFSRIDIVSSW